MDTSSRQQITDLHRRVERALRNGQCTAQELMEALGVNQPILSQTIRDLSSMVTMFRVSGDRTPRYALLRILPRGLNPRQRIYRVLSTGHIAPFAEVEFLAGGGTLERTDAGTTCVYEGLTPYMFFAAPSGYLGRQLVQAAPREHALPATLKDWNEDHRVAYLFTQGMNLPGNLIFGDASLQREIDLLRVPALETERKLGYYADMAQQFKISAYGSSAGGEQPKFLCVVQDAGHVIVKFARIGSRMADLLALEHLALRSLASVGVPAAKTELLMADGFVFLEVVRFDRIGATGLVGMLSASAVDDEFFGMRDAWPEFAARCVTSGDLAKQDAEYVGIMAAFSELIGNTDRHFENISLLIGEDGEYQGIAPAYDILPMRYASIGGGVDPELVPIEPKVGTIGAEPSVWKLAALAADEFWSSVASTELIVPIPRSIREWAQRNRQVACDFAAPLLPA